MQEHAFIIFSPYAEGAAGVNVSVSLPPLECDMVSIHTHAHMCVFFYLPKSCISSFLHLIYYLSFIHSGGWLVLYSIWCPIYLPKSIVVVCGGKTRWRERESERAEQRVNGGKVSSQSQKYDPTIVAAPFLLPLQPFSLAPFYSQCYESLVLSPLAFP